MKYSILETILWVRSSNIYDSISEKYNSFIKKHTQLYESHSFSKTLYFVRNDLENWCQEQFCNKNGCIVGTFTETEQCYIGIMHTVFSSTDWGIWRIASFGPKVFCAPPMVSLIHNFFSLHHELLLGMPPCFDPTRNKTKLTKMSMHFIKQLYFWHMLP